MTTPRRLPVPVPLVPAETLDSYLARLATANHLEPASCARTWACAPGERRRTWTDSRR